MASKPTFTCKWGEITIFNGGNYLEFRDSCMLALITAGAWRIVIGDETEPELGNDPTDAQVRQHQSFITRRGHAITILFGSVNLLYRGQIMAFAHNCAVDGMWDKLKESDQATNTIYVNNIRQAFFSEAFNPTKQTIRQFVGILQNWAKFISTAERRISEEDILEKLLSSLPSNSIWQTAKMFCLQQSLGLAESINLLSSNETPKVPESAASPNHNGRNESRKRKGGRVNQGCSDRFQGGGQGNFGNRGNSQSQSISSRRESSDRVKKSESKCLWCDIKGHKQQECRRYLASKKKDNEKKDREEKSKEKRDKQKKDKEKRDAERRDAERRDAERRDAERRDAERRDAERRDAEKRYTEKRDGNGEEATNVVIIKEEYNSFFYLPEQAMMSVTPSTAQWTLDSRATKHFISVKSDSQQTKRRTDHTDSQWSSCYSRGAWHHQLRDNSI